MSILIDTNILLRRAQVASAHHHETLNCLTALVRIDVVMCLVPQVIYEFWSAATRPADVNGLGMDIALADESVKELLRDFVLLRDERGVFANWQSLVVQHAVRGKTSHDARLVAAMQRHGLSNLLTFNKPDFIRFDGIQIYTPADVLSGRLPS